MPSPTVRRAAAIALLAATAAGCAHTQKEEVFVWPPPPDKPRVKWVASITGAGGYDQRWFQKVRGIFAGATTEDIVFNPNGIALSADDSKLYVTSALGFVLRFDRKTTAVDRVANAEDRSPLKPFGLALDTAGNLYVTDMMGEVFVYSANNRFLRRFGQGILDRPAGIAVDSRRQLVYVVDGGRQKNENHKVEVFAPDGRHLRTIGKRGTEPGRFLFPSYAAISPDGDLYVADTMNSRVQVFDPDGNLVGLLGAMGDDFGQFAKPKGIAFDSAGNVHVVDGQLAGVQIFNKKNQLLLGYGGLGTGVEMMQLPNGIAISAKNEVFVADYAGNRVSQYQLLDVSDSLPQEAPAPAAAAPGSAPGPAAASGPAAPAPATPAPPTPAAPPPAAPAQPAKPAKP